MAKENCGCASGKCGRRKDICATPLCGRPDVLSIYAPVIYDEIGINVCRPITIPAEVLTANPTAYCAQLEVVDITFGQGTEGIPTTTITSTTRANCSTVVLTNISLTYRVKLFDTNNNYLTSTIVTANYLPGSATSPEYTFFDSETNPESVTLELYTPYGVGFTEAGASVPEINVVGLIGGANNVANGINISAIAKAMNFDPATGTLSAGVSIVLRTIYYEAYKFEHEGKPVPPKASLNGDQNNTCLAFVESGLLSREIKPLELEPPKCEGRFKESEPACEREDGTKTVFNFCQCEQEQENPCENTAGVNMEEVSVKKEDK